MIFYKFSNKKIFKLSVNYIIMDDFENISKLLEEYDKVFIIGAGGVGKSYNINKIVDSYKLRGKIVEKTATTGVSAYNIKGKTINSLLKFADTNSIEEYNVYIKYMARTNMSFDINMIYNKLRNVVGIVDLLIIDEVSMISADKWELIDYILKIANFKGKILISGDVFQLPPISTKSKYLENDKKTDSRFFFESDNWKSYNFVPYVMEKIYRTNNIEFMEVLSNIRVGDVNQRDIQYLKNMMKNDYVINQNPTILASTNEFVFNYNKEKLSEIRNELCVIEYEIEYKQDFNDSMYKQEIEDYISKQLLIEKKLFVKVGALVIFISNGEQFYNGEKGIITDIQKDYISIRKDDGTDVKLQKQSFGHYDYIDNQFTLVANIKQFPIKLGYSLTIHKSQGLSIDNIILDITKIFTNGQFYVGISRATNPKNVYIQYSKGIYMFDVDIKKFVSVNDKLKLFYEKAKRKHLQYENIYK